MVESEAGLTRCWVLRERATDPSRPTPESLVLPGVSVGARSADVLPGLPASAPHQTWGPPVP
jgi:hypothetical protein